MRARIHRSRLRSPLSAGITAALLGGLLTACGSGNSGEPTINLYNAPQQNLQAMVDRCNQQAHGKYKIQLNTLPRDADGQREQLVRRLAAGDTGLDVLGLDVTWTAELAEAGWIREWTGANAEEASKGVIDGPLRTARYKDKLYAAPYNTNVQLLWYRSDLVGNTPPTTYDQMIAKANELAAANKPHYVETPGAQYEGLVVWYNAWVNSAGGTILNKDGNKVTLDDSSVRALAEMKKFATSSAADPSLTNMKEDQARLAMESGSGAMELNWPFVWAGMQKAKTPFAKSFRWAPYPGFDGVGSAPLGGANFAVSKYSAHPEESFQAALCLRDPENQKFAAIKDGLPPTIQSVYGDTTPLDAGKADDPEKNPSMTDAYPMKDAILAALKNHPSIRPTTPTYQNVSTTISALLSPPSGINPSSTNSALREQIGNALQSKGVLP